MTDEEEIAMLRRTVRGYVTGALRPHEAEVDAADEISPELMLQLRKQAVALGLYGYNMPAASGGPGLGRAAIAAIDEEMGHTSMPLAEAIGHLPGSLVHCDAAQRDWLLGPLLRADKTVAYALTEPDAGSDLNALRTRAARVEGGWRLDGAKHYISHADTADHTIVLAVTEKDAPLKSRLTTFIIPRHAPGFTITRRFRKMGWRGYQLSAISIEDCFVTDDHVLGAPGDGFAVMMATVNNDRLFVACRCVGMAQAALDLAVPYVRERKTFGKLLGDHQAIQFMLADSDVELEAGRLLCAKAAALADANDPAYRIAASRAKLFCSEMANRVADRAMQIFGGAGYMTDLPIERLYRDTRGFRIGEGTSEMQRLQIARAMIG